MLVRPPDDLSPEPPWAFAWTDSGGSGRDELMDGDVFGDGHGM